MLCFTLCEPLTWACWDSGDAAVALCSVDPLLLRQDLVVQAIECCPL